MKRRTWLAGATALGSATLLEWASLRGAFDNRRAAGTSSADVWLESLGRLDRGEEHNALVHLSHSTHLLVVDAVRILTDPWFYDPAFGSLVHAVLPPTLPERVGPLDAILISHDHTDHADLKAMDRMDKAAHVFLGDAALEARVRALGFRQVTRLAEWEEATLGALRLTATPALHDVHEVGFVIQGTRHTVYFAGDTALIDAHHEIAERFSPSTCVLPVDGTRVRGGALLVMDPEQAARATEILRSAQVFPSHAEASYSDPLAEHVLSTTVSNAATKFAARVAAKLPQVRTELTEPGQLVRLASRGPLATR